MVRRWSVLLAIAAVACPAPRPPRRARERIPREPDDTPVGAGAIVLANNRAEIAGADDGPGGDTVDWWRLERPASTGRYFIDLSVAPAVERDVWMDFRRGPEQDIAETHTPTTNGRTTFTVSPAPHSLFLRVYGGPGMGPYRLSITFVPDPDWPAIAIPDPPDLPDARRYCRRGEVSDACRAVACDPKHVDSDNPDCEPLLAPRP